MSDAGVRGGDQGAGGQRTEGGGRRTGDGAGEEPKAPPDALPTRAPDAGWRRRGAWACAGRAALGLTKRR